MFTLLVIVSIFIFGLLVLATGMRPMGSSLSMYELERRAGSGNVAARDLLRRQQLLPDVLSLQRVLSALLLVATVMMCLATFDWLLGTSIAVVVALEYGAIAKLGVVQRQAQKLYLKIEPWVLSTIEKFPLLVRILRSVPRDVQTTKTIDSRQELQHLVAGSASILTADEKKMIVHALDFGDQLVSQVMTPRSVIDSISKKEFLGPLTLDDLHKTGHSRLPVIDEDIDHVIGILHAQSLLTLDTKKSVTAEKAMEPRVFYIKQDQTLPHALAAFLRTHHHLFIVVNEFRETVGLITLEDVIEAMLGRTIIDEFDTHDDLRLVALRNPRANNHPEKREDV